MASGQCYREVDQTTVTTTTVTSRKVENGQQHHSLTDKVKEMAGKVFHHDAHNQRGHQSGPCHGSTATTCERKEGFVEKMKGQLKGMGGKKKHREGNRRNDSSSDESDC